MGGQDHSSRWHLARKVGTLRCSLALSLPYRQDPRTLRRSLTLSLPSRQDPGDPAPQPRPLAGISPGFGGPCAAASPSRCHIARIRGTLRRSRALLLPSRCHLARKVGTLRRSLALSLADRQDPEDPAPQPRPFAGRSPGSRGPCAAARPARCHIARIRGTLRRSLALSLPSRQECGGQHQTVAAHPLRAVGLIRSPRSGIADILASADARAGLKISWRPQPPEQASRYPGVRRRPSRPQDILASADARAGLTS